MTGAVRIWGGRNLGGNVPISGMKNSAMPALTAACLGKEPTRLRNLPLETNDIQNMIKLLRSHGAFIEVDGSDVFCAQGEFGQCEAKLGGGDIRYSLLMLGLSAALNVTTEIAKPGGCALKGRQHDMHLSGLSSFGHRLIETDQSIRIEPGASKAGTYVQRIPSTTCTENLILAAVLTPGFTTLHNCFAYEPVLDMIRLLNQMGARIAMAPHLGEIKIEGVTRLNGGTNFKILPGYDEAVTFAIAAAMTKSELYLKDCIGIYEMPEMKLLARKGLSLVVDGEGIRVEGHKFVGRVTKDVFNFHPSPHSDTQPLFSALNLAIPGKSVNQDLRYPDRWAFAEQMVNMGANLSVQGDTITVDGGHPIQGGNCFANDLRAGMALVLAGLYASGQTTIGNFYQVERGYNAIVTKLLGIGAKVDVLTHSRGAA